MYSVVGIKEVNYKRKDGSQCVGREFHLVEYDFTSIDQGSGVAKVFASQNVLSRSKDSNSIRVGSYVNLCYQLSGSAPRLVDINLCYPEEE